MSRIGRGWFVWVGWLVIAGCGGKEQIASDDGSPPPFTPAPTAQPTPVSEQPAPTAGAPAPEPAASASFADVQEVFAGACNFRGCHGGGSASGMLDLTGMPYDRLVNVSSPETQRVRVVPGDPASSYLYQKLTSDTPAAGVRMPLGGVLEAERTEVIRLWIAAGARQTP